MAKINVVKLDGSKTDIEVDAGTALMEGLRDAGLVDATCGGAASCGTCHVYFDNADLAVEQTEDEGYMLEGLADFVEIRAGSRLSCQLNVEAKHEGCTIEIAPEA